MGLLDGYFDLPQWPAEGGLLARLITLQKQQGQYQQGADPDQARSPLANGPAMSWSGLLGYRQAPSGQRVAMQEIAGQHGGSAAFGTCSPASDQVGIRKVGITSDQSSYCKTMKNLCHNQCFGMVFGRDAFGPYRACVRACMHNAGCFDF